MATVTTSVTDFSSTFGTLASTWTVVLEVLDNLGPELAFALTTLVLGSLFSHLKERSKATKGGSAATFAKSLCCKVPSAASAARPQCRSAAPLDKKKRQPLALQQFVDEVISTRMPAAKALTDYEEMRKIGLHMRIEKDLIGSSHSAVDFFRALVQCAGRSGRPALVELILDDMADAGVELPENIYESAMRLLSGKSCFKEALRVYKRMLQQNLEPSLTTMSCVIGFAAEPVISKRQPQRLTSSAIVAFPRCVRACRFSACTPRRLSGQHPGSCFTKCSSWAVKLILSC